MNDSQEDSAPAVVSGSLPRVLGLFDATCIIVGSIIGSGIFLKVGNVDKALMQFGFLPIISVWLFVGLVTLCGSLALAELGAMFPQAGGPYVYLRAAYGQMPAFLWAWTEFWVVRTGSVGALACATILYLNAFLTSVSLGPIPTWGQATLAVTMILGLSIVNIVSTRWGASVQNIATIAKVGFLAGLIVLPFVMGKMQPANLSPLWDGSDLSGLGKGLGLALIAVFWPYDGWINLGPVAEEIREPQRNIPRAMALGVLIVTLIYLGANFSYHLVLTMPHLAATKTAAPDVFKVLFGSIGSQIAVVGIMCSTFGATNSNMITGPRIYFAASRDGLLPCFIERVHPHFLTPANSIALQAIWTTLLTIAFYATTSNAKDAFDLITDAVICAGLIFYSLTVAAVFVLRFKQPATVRPYRTWGYPVTPALMIAAYAYAFVMQCRDQWDRIAWVLALIAAGVVYYWVASRWRRRAAAKTG